MAQKHSIVSAAQLGVIRIEGDDALSFLQGQSTPDLRKIGLGQSVFGAFCNAQGRVIANGWFQAGKGGFCLVISRDLVPTMIKRLRMYVLRAKVTVSDASDDFSLWLTHDQEPQYTHDWIIQGPMGVTLLAARPESFPNETLTLRGNAFALMLIQAGIPLVIAETSERYIPHMLSMDVLGGLSFDKGCYTGQEIVTRTQFLGKVKRTLYRIATDHNIQPDLGAPLKALNAGESVGEIFAWAPMPGGGATGLAVIKNEATELGPLEIAGHPIEAWSVADERPAT